jgi:hypothetical protein
MTKTSLTVAIDSDFKKECEDCRKIYESHMRKKLSKNYKLSRNHFYESLIEKGLKNFKDEI